MSLLLHWIWFASREPLSLQSRRLLMDRFGDPDGIYFSDRDALKELPLRAAEREALLDKSVSGAAETVSRCRDLDVGILTLQDAAYPACLRNISDPPYVLYVLGHLPAVDSEPVIGMVGTRRSSAYGDRMARSLAYEVAGGGGIIVTGLAGGIDSRAAEGALMAGGTVIGVLGTAINEVYPKWNTALFADVRAGGALISEYPPDAPGHRSYFPARNRIIAGLSCGVVVVEAPEHSGALITAARALDYGREVFAVPGNADAENFRGCNRLLREGAIFAESGKDILSEFALRFPERIHTERAEPLPKERTIPETNLAAEAEGKPRSGLFKLRLPQVKREKDPAEEQKQLEAQLSALDETELRIVGAIDRPDMQIDEIIARCGLRASEVLGTLAVLEIKGWVKQSPGKRYTLNIVK